MRWVSGEFGVSGILWSVIITLQLINKIYDGLQSRCKAPSIFTVKYSIKKDKHFNLDILKAFLNLYFSVI